MSTGTSGNQSKKRGRPSKPIENIVDLTLDPLDILQPKDDEFEGIDVIFMSAKAFQEQRKKEIERLVTGTPLDSLLKISGEGWETKSVYLIYGANNTGKTQLAHTMAVLNDYDVLYIDTEKTFRPERIAEIARLRGQDPDDALERIHVIQALNATHLELICAKIPKLFMRVEKTDDGKAQRIFREGKLKTGRVGLIIVDSLAPPFRVQYQGRERLNPRQQAILRVISGLKIISMWFNCAVIITDQIIDNPEGGFVYGPIWYRQKPVGGPTVLHNIDLQIMFRPSKDNIRVARVMDSSNTPLGEIEFMITERGIETVPEEEVGGT